MEKDQAYYESLDKRTKEYKEWVARKEAADAEAPKGLGDKVEKVFEKTGIKSLVNFIAGDDCGCDERKEKLNQMFPTLKPECLTEAEFNLLTEHKRTNKNTFRQAEQLKVLNIYNRVFHQRESPTSCGRCFNGKLNKLYELLDAYSG